MSKENQENPWIDMVGGVRRRTTVSGPGMSQMVVMLAAGSHLPEHHHPQDQIVHVVRGRQRLTVDGASREIGAGESLYLPGDVPHSAEALEDTMAVDTFSPPREDLLAQDAAQK